MIVSFVKDFRALIRPFIPEIRRAAGWVVLLQVLAMVEPFLVMQIVELVVEDQATARTLLEPLCAFMLAALVLIGFANVAKNRFIRVAWLKIDHDLPLLGGGKLLSLPQVYHQTQNTGMVVGKMVRGVYRTGEIVGIFLYEVFPLLVQTVVTAALLAHYRPVALAVFVPVFLAFLALTAWVKLKWAPHRLGRHAQVTKADELLGQAVMNVMTTQAFGQEEREIRGIRAVRDHIDALTEPEFRAYDVNDLVRNALVSFGRVAVVYLCASAVLSGAFSVALLMFVVTLAEKVFMNCYRIGAIFDRAMEAVDSVREINAILAEPDTVPEPDAPVEVPRQLVRSIRLEGVSYAYRGKRDGRATNLALEDIDLELPAGKVVAIVGESGGGKSTIAKLLIRCDDPTKGRITMDGVDLRSMRRHDLRSRFGYVLQDVQIYDLTVAENIAYGWPDASRERIEAAARIANAHEFILRLEDGYDTRVGDRGFKLSGGQRQRIGIARAWLVDPPVIILDEATSSVDTESERKIQQSMDRLREGRTMVVIAHRLSTIRQADVIVVMRNGRIQETGTHAELLRGNGIYHRLVAIQNHEEAIA